MINFTTCHLYLRFCDIVLLKKFQANVKTTSFLPNDDFFIDPLMVRVQPVGAVSSLSLDLKQDSNPNKCSVSNTQPPPLPPRYVSSFTTF